MKRPKTSVFLFHTTTTIKIQETLHSEVNAKAPELRLRLGLRGTKCCMLYSHNSSSPTHLPPSTAPPVCTRKVLQCWTWKRKWIFAWQMHCLTACNAGWWVEGVCCWFFFLLLLVEMFLFVFDKWLGVVSVRHGACLDLPTAAGRVRNYVESLNTVKQTWYSHFWRLVWKSNGHFEILRR